MTEASREDELQNMMIELVDQLAGLRTGKRGRYYAALFMDEPDANEYPEYYQVIHNPMSLNTVRRLASTNKYATFDEFERDMILIFNNARFFNEEESQVYLDANHLERAFRHRLEKKKKAYNELIGVPTIKISKKRKVDDAEEGDDAAARSVKLKISLREQEDNQAKAEKQDKTDKFVKAEKQDKSEKTGKPDQAEKPSQKIKLHLTKQPKPAVKPEPLAVEAGSPSTKADEPPSTPADATPTTGMSMSPQSAVPGPTVKRGRGRPRKTDSHSSSAIEPGDGETESMEYSRSIGRKATRASEAASPSFRGTAALQGAPAALNGLVSSVSAMPVAAQSPGDAPVKGGVSQSASRPQEESRLRLPGKTISDALITQFAVSADPRHVAYPPYSIVFPPHETEVFQSFTIILPAAYNVVTISPTLSYSLLTRHYNLYMSLNNRRLSPTIIPGNGVRKGNEPPKSFYEVKLTPGVNVVECLVHASPPPPIGGRVGRVVAPQRHGMIGGANMSVNAEGSEKERIVVWIMLQRG
ncbi:uncharacterized protein V1518DRAFT_408844 [Limtongia smithiae]|uniref:uncharacterized protein n=1 Tax=Limtongia smithiae TaxID=1125753 RepID=UPI0034CEB57C